MRIAIDVSPLKSAHKFRGVGSYTKKLTTALQEIIAADSQYKNWQINLIRNLKLEIRNFDLVHYPYFDLFWLTLPLKKPYPTVVTIHDVIPLVFPDKFPKGIKGWVKYQIQKFSLKGVKAVICDSQNSQKDIVGHLDFPKEKIFVVSLAPGEEFKQLTINNQQLAIIQKKYSLPETFLLYVGDVNYNKNISGLIRAFKQVSDSPPGCAAGATPPRGWKRIGAKDTSGVKLVLAGKAFKEKGLKETKEILRLIKELGLINQIKILGYVPDKDLVAIYNLATVYCQPSFYEGFGLPVLEAMACGTPVVAGKTSSLLEICGDAALMVDPYDINDIAAGLEKVIYDISIYDKLVKKGLKQAKKFSWEKTARETIKVYESVIENK